MEEVWGGSEVVRVSKAGGLKEVTHIYIGEFGEGAVGDGG